MLTPKDLALGYQGQSDMKNFNQIEFQARLLGITLEDFPDIFNWYNKCPVCGFDPGEIPTFPYKQDRVGLFHFRNCPNAYGYFLRRLVRRWKRRSPSLFLNKWQETWWDEETYRKLEAFMKSLS